VACQLIALHILLEINPLNPPITWRLKEGLQPSRWLEHCCEDALNPFPKKTVSRKLVNMRITPKMGGKGYNRITKQEIIDTLQSYMHITVMHLAGMPSPQNRSLSTQNPPSAACHIIIQALFSRMRVRMSVVTCWETRLLYTHKRDPWLCPQRERKPLLLD